LNGLSIEDRQWLEKRHKAMRSMRLAGWITLLIPLIAGAWLLLAMRPHYERLASSMLGQLQESHVEMDKRTHTELERWLVKEVKREDQLLIQLMGLLLLVGLSAPLGVMVVHGMMMLSSMKREQRLLGLIDRVGHRAPG